MCVCMHVCVLAVVWLRCVCVCVCVLYMLSYSEVRGVGVTVVWFKVNSDVTSGSII